MVVVIMRGISGSGKSTAVRRLRKALAASSGGGYDVDDDGWFVVCSADDFFVDRETGQYAFDRALLPDAHAACFRRFQGAISSSSSSSLSSVSSSSSSSSASSSSGAQSQDPPRRMPSRFVVVDNTNTKRWEYAKYVKAAEAERRVAAVRVLELSVTTANDLNEVLEEDYLVEDDSRETTSSKGVDEAAIAACAARNCPKDGAA